MSQPYVSLRKVLEFVVGVCGVTAAMCTFAAAKWASAAAMCTFAAAMCTFAAAMCSNRLPCLRPTGLRQLLQTKEKVMLGYFNAVLVYDGYLSL